MGNISSMIYTLYFHYLHNILYPHNHKQKHIDVPYNDHKGNRYMIRVDKHKRGPATKSVTYHHKNKDITENLKYFAGPNNDFHRVRYKPSHLGYDEIIVRIYDDDETEEYTFNSYLDKLHSQKA